MVASIPAAGTYITPSLESASAVATMLIGNSTRVEDSLFMPATTAASLIASELTNANDSLHASALIAIALVLFGITLLLNLVAR